MIPGQTTKLSLIRHDTPASGILEAKTDIIMLDGDGVIHRIIPHFGGGFSGWLALVPSRGGGAGLTLMPYSTAEHPTPYPLTYGSIEGGGIIGGLMTLIFLHPIGVWVLGRPAGAPPP